MSRGCRNTISLSQSCVLGVASRSRECLQNPYSKDRGGSEELLLPRSSPRVSQWPHPLTDLPNIWKNPFNWIHKVSTFISLSESGSRVLICKSWNSIYSFLYNQWVITGTGSDPCVLDISPVIRCKGHDVTILSPSFQVRTFWDLVYFTHHSVIFYHSGFYNNLLKVIGAWRKSNIREPEFCYFDENTFTWHIASPISSNRL